MTAAGRPIFNRLAVKTSLKVKWKKEGEGGNNQSLEWVSKEKYKIEAQR
jgi:hypothetical protein